MSTRYIKITEMELSSKLIAHVRFLVGDPTGVRLDLSNHNLRELGHILNGSKLSLGDLSGSNCAHVNFNRCSVDRTNFTGANLRNAKFRTATNLESAMWEGASTVGTTFGSGRVPSVVADERVLVRMRSCATQLEREKARREAPVRGKAPLSTLDEWLVKFKSWSITVDEEPISYGDLPKEMFICKDGAAPCLDIKRAVVWVKATRSKRERAAEAMVQDQPALVMRDGVPLPPIN